MAIGVMTKGKLAFCKKCKRELKMTVPDNIFNFCPHCGSPLNIVSLNLYKEREKIIQLKAIDKMQKRITNKDDLKNLLVLMDEISKK